jgi:hypothetical protein
MKNINLIKSHSSNNNFSKFSFTNEILTNVFEKFYITLIMTMLLNQSANSQANVYHPFPENNAVWIVSDGGFLGNYCPCECYTTCYYNQLRADSLNGDTLINSKVYKKLYRAYTTVTYFMNNPATCVPGCSPTPVYTYSNYTYKGGIRQDTALKKVYFIPVGSNNETLLYDFSLNVGDTLKQSYLSMGGITTVTSIDSILLNDGAYRKRILVHNYFPSFPYNSKSAYFIEGVGSSLGLLEMIMAPNDRNYYLECFKENSIPIYSYNGSYSCPSIPIKVNEINHNSSFSISPNPFSNFTTLHAKENLNNATLNIFNAFGQLVSQIKNINGNTININRNNLPAGFYFAQLSENNQVIGTTKLIIVD